MIFHSVFVGVISTYVYMNRDECIPFANHITHPRNHIQHSYQSDSESDTLILEYFLSLYPE